MAVSESRPRGNPNWTPGISGNPKGRPQRKPITTALLAALDQPWRPGENLTLRKGIIWRLSAIVMEGEDKEAVKVIELLWKYLEGMPVQTVALDFEQALEDIQIRTGAPRAWLMQRAEAIKARYAIDEVPVDVPYRDVTEPMKPAVRAVRGKPRAR
jgi:hypothetical protein